MSNESEILDAVDKLYATALDDEAWTPALDSVSGLFGAVGASFEVIETASKRPVVFELGTELRFDAALDYIDYYAARSPRVAFNIDKPSGFISYDHLILSDADIDKDEFYMDLMAPLGLRYFVAVQVSNSASHNSVLAVQRSPEQGHIGELEIALLQRLTPHLRRALDLRFRFEASNSVRQLGLEALEQLGDGCILATRSGRALHLNARARAIVSRNDGIGLRANRLRFSDGNAATHLRVALRQTPQMNGNGADGAATDFPARRPSGDRPYVVSVRPVPENNRFTPYAPPEIALVFIRDPTDFARLNLDLLRASYDLSEAEAQIAGALDGGATVTEIARARGVARSTVRSQLYSLMGKLGVRRQSDLIRLLACRSFAKR